jgi:hypothetical protein
MENKRDAQELDGAKLAKLAEAVPAGQLSFKRKGWSKRGLAGKVEAVASLPAGVDEEKIEYELVAVAGRYLPADKIHIDENINPLIHINSGVAWSNEANKPLYLNVYFDYKAEKLPVLAHEVGHLETLLGLGGVEFYNSNYRNRYHAEVEASRWAIKFLASHGFKGRAYAEAVNRLQKSLDGYWRASREVYRGTVRYILDESIENKKTGVAK